MNHRLIKTTCRICGEFPVYIDEESGIIWDDVDEGTEHIHTFAFHKADDEGFTRRDAGYHNYDGGL